MFPWETFPPSFFSTGCSNKFWTVRKGEKNRESLFTFLTKKIVNFGYIFDEKFVNFGYIVTEKFVNFVYIFHEKNHEFCLHFSRKNSNFLISLFQKFFSKF